MALTKIDDRGLKTPIDLLDNEKIRFGTGNDLEVFHDGSNSYITDAGTGSLRINSNDARIINAAGSEDMARFMENGAVELYYDNSKKLETTSAGVNFTGEIRLTDGNIIRLGDATYGDLKIYHTGSANYIDNAEGHPLHIKYTGGEDLAKFTPNGSVELYYDNSKKFETTNIGVTVTGKLSPTSNIHMPDSTGIKLGASDDLVLYHYATDNTNRIESGTNCPMLFQYWNGSSYEVMSKLIPNGAVELYDNNVKKFETTSTGIKVSGIVHVYDSDKLVCGTGQDLQIYHDGSDSVIADTNASSDLFINSNKDLTLKIGDGAGGNHTALYADNNGAVRLYWDNSNKFETTSYGFKTPHYIQLGTSGTATANWHIGQENDGSFRFYNGNYGAGNEVLRVKYDGDLSIADGNLVVASGHGISFINAADTATGETVSSSVLDEYEEGTFALAATSNATMTSASGTYTKVGRLVHVKFSFQINQINSGSTTHVTGLPFSAAQTGFGSTGYFASIGNFNSISPYASGSTVYFNVINTNNVFAQNPAILGNSSRVDGAITYTT